MKQLLMPKMKFKDIYSIDFVLLYNMGYKNIILDVDNTIVPWNNHNITIRLFRHIQYIKNIGFKICLLSNNSSKSNVKALADGLQVLYAHKGAKPFPGAFKVALEELDGCIDNTLIIGDQIFTDILGGNIMGIGTVLVDPISKKEFITTKFMRLLERILTGRKIKYDNRY